MLGKFKQTRLKSSSSTSAPAKKARKTKRQPKRLSKADLDARLHSARVAILGLLLLASFALIVTVSLIVTGGWDSTNILIMSLVPLFSMGALLLAYWVAMKYGRRKFDFWICYYAFIFFSFAFFCALGFLTIRNVRNKLAVDYEPKLVGTFNCASSEMNRDYSVYDVKFALSKKHYIAVNMRGGGAVHGSYAASFDGDVYHMNTLIRDNTEKDKALGFDETSYTIEFEDDNKVRFSSTSSGIVRFCVKE